MVGTHPGTFRGVRQDMYHLVPHHIPTLYLLTAALYPQICRSMVKIGRRQDGPWNRGSVHSLDMLGRVADECVCVHIRQYAAVHHDFWWCRPGVSDARDQPRPY